MEHGERNAYLSWTRIHTLENGLENGQRKNAENRKLSNLTGPGPPCATLLEPLTSPLTGHNQKVHGDLATASNVELASACVMNAVLRGKNFPGLPVPASPPPPPRPRQPCQGHGDAADLGAEKKGEAGGEREGEGEMAGAGEGEGRREERGCVFEVALSVALRQHEEFPHPVSNVWAAGVMVLLHEWMVNRGEFRAAEG